MKRFELYDVEHGHSVCQINVKTNSHNIYGVAYTPVSWDGETGEIGDKDFFATYSVKWDGCSHFWFYGQDYYADKEKEYPYYHICGVNDYLNHMKMMQFIMEVAYSEMKDVFFDMELNDLIELREYNLLNGYEIKELEIPEWEIEDLEKIISK